MRKKELLEALKESIRTEEGVVSLYLKHLDAFCTRFNLDKEYIAKLKEGINYMIKETKIHKKVCEDMYKKVSEDERDDF
jgi:hypothetical protein